MQTLRKRASEDGLILIEFLVILIIFVTMAVAVIGVSLKVRDSARLSETIKTVEAAAATVNGSITEHGPLTEAVNADGGFTITNGDEEQTTTVTSTSLGDGKTVNYSMDLHGNAPVEYTLSGTLYNSKGAAVNYAIFNSETRKTDSGNGAAPGSPEFLNRAAQPLNEVDNKASALWWQIPVGVVGGLIVLIGGWFSGRFAFKKAKTSRAITTNNVMQWQRLIDTHNEVRHSWSEYEMDIVRMIDFPTMTDMTDDFTAKLHQALDRARRLAPESAKKAAIHDAIGSDYESAITDLKTAFAAAETHAKKVSWSNFSAVERKRLRRAKDLLAMAYDSASSPSERQVAYKQALKELDGLIVPPVVTLAALEQKITLLLEATPSGATVNMSTLLTKQNAQPMTA